MNNTVLLNEIEQHRNKMITLSHTNDLTSDIVVQSSKQLDDLLNKYQKELVNA